MNTTTLKFSLDGTAQPLMHSTARAWKLALATALLWLLSSWCFAGASAPATPASWEQALEASLEAYGQGNYAQAAGALDAAALQFGEHAELVFWQGRVRLQQQDWAGARSHFQRFCQLDPTNAEGPRLLASAQAGLAKHQVQQDQQPRQPSISSPAKDRGALGTAAKGHSPVPKPLPAPAPAFSLGKAIGCFALGLVWLGLCGLLARLWGGGLIAAVVGLVLGFSLLLSKDGMSTWVTGHQIAFWLGLACSVLLSLLAFAKSRNA
jgi:tetratricopeptide (TPR) repeat protein